MEKKERPCDRIRRYKKAKPELYGFLRHGFRKRYRKRYPERDWYSRTISRRIKQKRLTRGSCTVCGSSVQVECCSFLQDLNNPTWLCNTCHRALHYEGIYHIKTELLS